MSKRFRTLLIGLGRIGAAYAEDRTMAATVPYVTHAQVLADHPAFEWHGAVDTSDAATRFVQSRFGVQRIGTSVNQIASLDQVDVVVLATPPSSRVGILDALPNLRAVLVEKPLGATLQQSEAFLNECQRRDLVTQVNLTRRADSVMRKLAQGGLNDRIGRVQCGFGTFGNGVLNYSTHTVDLVRMLVGEITAVQAMPWARAFDEGPLAGDRNLSFTLFVGDVPVTLHPVRFSEYREGSLDLWGEKGRLEFLQEGLQLRETRRAPCRSLDGTFELDSSATLLHETGYGRALFDLYDDLAAVMEGARKATCSPCESALTTERVVHAVLESARRGGALIEIGRASPSRRDVSKDGCVDVLIAVEDPGAANFVLELPAALERAGLSSCILACGHAGRYLSDRHVASEEYPSGLSARDLADRRAFRLLLAGTSQNPDSPVLALIDECTRRGVPAIGFVDMAADANLRFNGRSNNPLQHAPGSLIVADRTTERAFADLGFPGERVHVCGHPAYDRVRRRATELAKRSLPELRVKVLGADPAPRPVWTFAAEHGDDDPRQRRSADYTLHGRGTSDRRADIVLEEILDVRASMIPRPFLVLRLHPKNTREEFARYLSEVDMVSQGGDPIELIWSSDLVLGMSSILLMEAAIAGRPTLSVVPRECERIWSPSVTEDLTPSLSTRDELKSTLVGKPVATRVKLHSDPLCGVVDVILRQLRTPL